MKRILSIFSLTILVSTNSFGNWFDKSPKWELFNKTNYDLIKLDVNSIKYKNEYVSFWYVNEMNMFPGKFFLWKTVYDCKKRKSMILFYDMVPSIGTLPKNIPDMVTEDKWLDITTNRWDADMYTKLCVKKIYF
jgi:hypothetical protein